MRRIVLILAALLCLTAPAFAQTYLPLDLALTTALNDVNQRLGTAYTYDSGQVAYLYEEVRVDGDNLGCPVVSETSNATFYVTVVQFDTQLDNIYEWEYRLAYDADGNIRMVLCDAPPGGTRGPGFNTTPQPTNTPTDTPTNTPTRTPTGTPPPILIGRDGPRVLPPLICDGLPSRLIVGSTGRVIVGDTSNNLRQRPDRDSVQVGDLFPGEVFTVVDGPICEDNYTWYAVEVNGDLKGWTAEGTRGDYFIEPVLTDAARIIPANAAGLLPYGLPFAPGTSGITAEYGGYMVTYDIDSAQAWTLPQDLFTTLANAAWQAAGPEVVGQFNFVHRDWLGRIWTADALTGALVASNEPNLAPFALPVIGGIPILSVDMESHFIAVPGTTPETILVYEIDPNGGEAVASATLGLNGPLRDLAFWPDGTGLYAATDTEIALYTFELGDGWSGVPVTIFTHDVANPKLATSLDGSTVAVSGTAATGVPGLRVYNVSLVNTVSVTAGAAINGEPGTTWSRPSVNPDGSLVAYSSSLGAVRVSDTVAGATVAEIASGVSGPVAFSMDGLVLLAPTANQQVQMFGVALPPDLTQVTATPTFAPGVVVVTQTPTFGPLVVTATPTFGAIVVTATPTFGPIVVTATPTMEPTLAPPTASQ